MYESDILLLKRAFPLFPTAFAVTLAILGHESPSTCLSGIFVSSPVWYWVNYQIVLYPFITLWPNNETMFTLLRYSLGLFLLSLCLSLLETGAGYVSSSQDVGWAAGYTLHVLSVLLLVLYHYHERRKEVERIERDIGHHGSWLALIVTFLSVMFSLLSSWSYTLSRHVFFQSIVIYFLLPIQGIVLYFDRKRNVRFSYAYCIFYSVLGMRLPDFLAYGSVRLFVFLGETAQGANNNPSFLVSVFHSSDAIRYLVSFGYLFFMMIYIRLLKKVIQSMSAPFTYARFLFHAQFYCYSCYYILVSTARRLDFLFFFILFVMNVYYVLNNTGTLSEWMDRLFRKCDFCETSKSPMKSDTTSPDVVVDRKRRNDNTTTPGEDFSKSSDRIRLIQLAFKMKIAEQDLLADSTALLAIPTLITVFSSLAARDALHTANQLSVSEQDMLEIVRIRVEHFDGTPLDLVNLWIRFGIMFFARWIGSHVSKHVFACKVKGSVFFRSYMDTPRNNSHKSNRDEIDEVEKDEEQLPLNGRFPLKKQSSIIEVIAEDAESFTDAAIRQMNVHPEQGSKPTIIKTQPEMTVDQFQTAILTREFPNVFPYFILVTVHSLFSLFQNPELPTRYAFCSFTSLQH